MTPAETIQAAIDKLTRLRRADEPGPLRWHDTVDGFEGLVAANGDYVISAHGNHTAGWIDVADETADLFVALHATIDAQLDILRFQLASLESSVRAGFTPQTIESLYSHALLLARAILGEQVTDD